MLNLQLSSETSVHRQFFYFPDEGILVSDVFDFVCEFPEVRRLHEQGGSSHVHFASKVELSMGVRHWNPGVPRFKTI